MKWRFSALGPLVLALCVFALPLHAQTSEVSTKSITHPWYDISQEVRLSGTVSVVEKTPARGTEAIAGSHLIVETSTGKVKASLGRYALKGKSPLSLRVIQVNGHQYTIRNERGLATAAIARGKANSGTTGGTL
jgi:hypothetical protein